MTKTYAQSFWTSLLTKTCKDQAFSSLENPALTFTRKAQAGDYDALSDASG